VSGVDKDAKPKPGDDTESEDGDASGEDVDASGEDVDNAPPEAKFPAGTRGLETDAIKHEQEELPTPLWLKWKREIDLIPPYRSAKDVYTILEEEKKYYKDSHGFEIIKTWNGNRGILFTLPDRREAGWDSVKWETVKQLERGDHRWRSALCLPHGGKYPYMEEKSIRLLEDYEMNYIELKEPFTLDTEPTPESIEYDFVRLYPIEGLYDPDEFESSQRVLRCLGMRMPHRALFMLTMMDINYIRHNLITSIIWKKAPEIINPLKRLEKARSSSNTPKEKEEYRKEAATLISKTLERIFRDYRLIIEKTGFTVFDGIMNPNPKNIIDVPFLQPQTIEELEMDTTAERFQKYTEYFENLAPSSADFKKMLDPEFPRTIAMDIFASITDEHKSPDDDEDENKDDLPVLHVDSRLTTRKDAVTDMFVEMEDKELGESLLKAKLYQEVALMQLAHWLRLEEPGFDTTSVLQENSGSTKAELRQLRHSFKKLYCPDTGSRLIMNASKNGKEQTPHVDYYFNKQTKVARENEAFELPPYLAEITSYQPTPIWLLEDSHKMAGKSWRSRMEISHSSPLRLCFLPPWSIFISRGDVIHAGSSGRMANKLKKLFPGSCKCPRIHLYMGRIGVPLPDSINVPHCHYFAHKTDDMKITDLKVLLSMFRTK